MVKFALVLTAGLICALATVRAMPSEYAYPVFVVMEEFTSVGESPYYGNVETSGPDSPEIFLVKDAPVPAADGVLYYVEDPMVIPATDGGPETADKVFDVAAAPATVSDDESKTVDEVPPTNDTTSPSEDKVADEVSSEGNATVSDGGEVPPPAPANNAPVPENSPVSNEVLPAEITPVPEMTDYNSIERPYDTYTTPYPNANDVYDNNYLDYDEGNPSMGSLPYTFGPPMQAQQQQRYVNPMPKPQQQQHQLPPPQQQQQQQQL